MISHDCFNHQDHPMNIILPAGRPVESSMHIGDHLVPDTSLLNDQTPAPMDIPLDLPRTPGAWIEGVRDTVTSHPLAAIATAFALGSMVARLRR